MALFEASDMGSSPGYTGGEPKSYIGGGVPVGIRGNIEDERMGILYQTNVCFLEEENGRTAKSQLCSNQLM
jgi:hypothetical protein